MKPNPTENMSVKDKVRFFENLDLAARVTIITSNSNNNNTAVLKRYSSEPNLEWNRQTKFSSKNHERPNPPSVSTENKNLKPILVVPKINYETYPDQLIDPVSDDDILFDPKYLKKSSKPRENIDTNNKSNRIIDIIKRFENLEAVSQQSNGIKRNKDNITILSDNSKTPYSGRNSSELICFGDEDIESRPMENGIKDHLEFREAENNNIQSLEETIELEGLSKESITPTSTNDEFEKLYMENGNSLEINENKQLNTIDIRTGSDENLSEEFDEIYYETLSPEESEKNGDTLNEDYLENNKSSIDCALEELVMSEKSHVDNMTKIMEILLPEVTVYYGLTMSELLFGNVEEIYQKTVEFYGDLLEAALDLEKTSIVLSQMEPLCQLYTVYTRTIQNLEENLETLMMLQEKNQGKVKLNKRELQEALSRVARRITEYDILIKNLKQQIEKERGNSEPLVDEACKIIEKYHEKSNMCGYLAHLTNCSQDFSCHGDLILVHDFHTRGKSKMSLRIFLFEEIIIIAREIGQKCEFIDSIPVDELKYGPGTDTIELTKRQGSTYKIYSDKPAVMQRWKTELENIMYHQIEESKAKLQRQLSIRSEKDKRKSPEEDSDKKDEETSEENMELEANNQEDSDSTDTDQLEEKVLL